MDIEPVTRKEWGFYGRREELDTLREILRRERWFLLKVSGRRRIGKTSLVHQALQAEGRDKVLYIQIPDSDPAGVVSAARDFYDLFKVESSRPVDLRSLAASISEMVRRGYVVAVDEFQYFHRKSLFEFTSHLQFEVDRLARDASEVRGGVIVLGSIHTEMAALLEDRGAPLFARLTHSLEVPHLDIASVLEILRAHAEPTSERLLFLWNLFEGVPKFYRDAYEKNVLGADRRELLRELFFSSSSPLRTEAENWFLRELRGRYDLVLKYVARNPGCSNGEILAHARSVEPDSEKQIGGYVKVLRERYQMVEQLQPVFAKSTARNGRYYISDNFLRSWLAALSAPTASVNFKPIGELIPEADERLAEAEGHGLEKLVATLYEERSRKGLDGFRLSQRIQGFWDRGDTELDLVALNEDDHVVRLGSCKRSAEKLAPDFNRFDEHVARFLERAPQVRGWRVEKAAIATRHSTETRRAAERAGYIPQDLEELTAHL
jgi:AAA+ ATPase superfamily predicted ATPase